MHHPDATPHQRSNAPVTASLRSPVALFRRGARIEMHEASLVHISSRVSDPRWQVFARLHHFPTNNKIKIHPLVSICPDSSRRKRCAWSGMKHSFDWQRIQTTTVATAITPQSLLSSRDTAKDTSMSPAPPSRGDRGSPFPRVALVQMARLRSMTLLCSNSRPEIDSK